LIVWINTTLGNWVEVEEKNVKIINHSTSSLIEIQLTTIEEVNWAEWDTNVESIWLESGTLDNLKKAISKIK